MSQENKPSARPGWLKPVLTAVIVGALAVGGYAAFVRAPMAPDVTFVTIKGDKISSQNLRGKVVMVNFWATTCASCVREMPQMIDTYNKFKGQGMEFVAVAMRDDRPDHVINFSESHKLPFLVALDSGGDIAKSFDDTRMTPTTFVIAKDGRILKRYVGIPDFNAVHALLATALAEPAAS